MGALSIIGRQRIVFLCKRVSVFTERRARSPLGERAKFPRPGCDFARGGTSTEAGGGVIAGRPAGFGLWWPSERAKSRLFFRNRLIAWEIVVAIPMHNKCSYQAYAPERRFHVK